MLDNKSAKELGVIAWLLALSFSMGVSYMQIQSNTELIQSDIVSRRRMWDAINGMRDEIHTIAGYIKGREENKR